MEVGESTLKKLIEGEQQAGVGQDPPGHPGGYRIPPMAFNRDKVA